MSIKKEGTLADRMFDSIQDTIEGTVKEAMDERLEELSTDEGTVEKLTDKAQLRAFSNTFKSNGFNSLEEMTTSGEDSNKRLPLKDLLTSEHFSHLFPKYVTNTAIEAAEPELNVTNLLDIIPFQGMTYRTPVFSGFGGNFDMAEGDEPRKIEVESGKWQDITLGKAGVSVDVTEEALRYNEYNILNLYINAAGRALARWKEKKAVSAVLDNATTLKDNDDGNYDNLSGLGSDGTSNGGLAFDDLVDAIVDLRNKGFNADTIIMHPLAYPIFMKNGTIRSLFWASGGQRGSLIQNPQTTSFMQNLPGSWEKPAPEGKNIISVPGLSSLLGTPMNIVLTPFATYNKGTGSDDDKTDILIGDSKSLGQLVIDQLPTTSTFDDPVRQIRKFMITERYAIAPHYSGQGSVTLKNVEVVKTYDFERGFTKTIS